MQPAHDSSSTDWLVPIMARQFPDLARLSFQQSVEHHLHDVRTVLLKQSTDPGRVDPGSVLASVQLLLNDELVNRLTPVVFRMCESIIAVGPVEIGDSEHDLRQWIERHGLDLMSGAFPLLPDTVGGILSRQARAIAEALQRYFENHALIEQGLLHGSSGSLRRITPLGEETHNEGQRPLRFEFSSGHTVVYKPRSLGMEASFQWCLEKVLKARGKSSRRQPAIVDLGTHGWMEWIEAVPARTREQLEAYHYHFGLQLAVADLLGMGDMHSENVIAVADEPVMVDCEVCVAIDLPWYDPPQISHFDTVLGLGLLPWEVVGSGVRTRNRAGLATSAKALVHEWQVSVDDDARLSLSRVEKSIDATHSPFLGNSLKPDWPSLGRRLADGFRDGADSIRELLDQADFSDTLTRRLDGQIVRILPRTTWHYARLQSALHGAEGLADKRARGQLLAKLELADARHPGISQLASHEQSSLLAGDVPAFHGRLGSRELIWQGQCVAADFLPPSATQALGRRWRRLGAADTERQVRLIQQTFGLYELPTLQCKDSGSNVPADPRSLAAEVGEWLLSRQTSDYWFEANLAGDSARVAGIDTSLETGVLGISVFFAGLAAAGEAQFEDHARRLANVALDRSEAALLDTGPGGHAGLGGLMFSLCSLSSLLDDAAWIERAERLLPLLEQTVARDERMDLMAGCAGALAAATELARCTGSPDAMRCAQVARERILAHHVPANPGCAWLSCTTADGRPLPGMAHGSSGIRMALMRLQSLDPIAEVDDRVAGAVEFEAAGFDFELRRFDARHPSAHDRQTTIKGEAWCNGTLGIALADVDIGQQQARHGSALMHAALGGVHGRLQTDNHSLCHGDLGNLLMLSRLKPAYPDALGSLELEVIRDRLLSELSSGPIHCGARPFRTLHGMMAGLAGIGYGLLLLDHSDWPDPLRLRLGPL
ncbi:type 2 lantipeptide synthetase LanM [Wenzhouxiangella sp. AB-CW3]|uniref:type 2 lanthipeptide synthetase LanM n=1 Tax=Wenzhouxiangella sp. AB-CW3 TaxID=2771012 RepID=UPI00168B6218|nr:type 2 lanthipeptide synthetase LanM [Wenzhouxiangella sp. AB-CW3]QOC22781.1 type 2 lantipeptide synthetase LanM [Wenzhouxiangella sp. AB-CW3]